MEFVLSLNLVSDIDGGSIDGVVHSGGGLAILALVGTQSVAVSLGGCFCLDSQLPSGLAGPLKSGLGSDVLDEIVEESLGIRDIESKGSIIFTL